MQDNDGWELIGHEGVVGGFSGADSLGRYKGRDFHIAMAHP